MSYFYNKIFREYAFVDWAMMVLLALLILWFISMLLRG